MNRLRDALSVSAEAFRNRNLVRLELGWLGAITAEFAYAVAVSVYAYRQDGAAAVGLVWLLRMIPAALAAPVLSTLGDRVPRQRIMFWGNLVRCAATALSVAAMWADLPVAVYGLSVLVAIASTAFWPAQAALLPTVARTPKELAAANTVSSALEGLGSFVGPAACGALLALTSIEVAFAAAAASFLGAAVLVARVEVPFAERPRSRFAIAEGLMDALGGFRAVTTSPSITVLVAIYTSWALASGALNVLIVVAAIELLEIGEGGVGVLNAAIGVGGIVGAVASLSLADTGRFGLLLGVGMIAWSVPLALVGVWPATVLAAVFLGVLGLGNIVMDTAALTLLQRVVPDEVLARVLGLIEGLWVGGIGVGAAVVAPVITLVGIRGALVAAGLVLPLLAIVAWSSLRSMDVDADRPGAVLDLLRSIPLFAALPPAALERLAANFGELKVAEGDEIVRQDDVGDRFYLVTDGTVDVSADGRSIGTFGPGYFFGEIALLRRVPRTATVRAVTDVSLRSLDADVFVPAVVGHAAAAAAADDVVDARLAGLGRLSLRRA